MTDIETLLAIEAIRTLKAAYFRCLDTKAWAEFDDLFTEDASFDARGALEMPKPDAAYDEPIITGRAAIVDYVSAALAPIISVHHGHMPEIQIQSMDAATGTWPMNDMLIMPPGGPFRVFRGYGHYWERYARQDGRWRIAALKLRRLYVERD